MPERFEQLNIGRGVPTRSQRCVGIKIHFNGSSSEKLTPRGRSDLASIHRHHRVIDWKNSGCFVNVKTLGTSNCVWGGQVNFVRSKLHVRVYTKSILFNHVLRYREFSSRHTILGFDADEYSLATRRAGRHLACINGLIRDLLQYDTRLTWVKIIFQAYRKKSQAQMADFTVSSSRYCAERLDELCSVSDPMFIPEVKDLDRRPEQLRENPFPTAPKHRAIVRRVCRLYSRKCICELLRAASLLRAQLPKGAIRIVGGEPDAIRLRRLWRDLSIDGKLRWPGDVGAVYLVNVQERFGIILLEAMAVGKPIETAYAVTALEVVRHRLLVEPENNALADATAKFDENSQLRNAIIDNDRCHAKRFSMLTVARCFMETVRKKIKQTEETAQ